MARRARMLVLLQLSSLVFLLVAEVTHTAPVSDGSSINTIRDDRDGVSSENRDDAAHTVAPNEDKPGDSVAESDHHATTVQDVNSVSTEEVDMHVDSVVTKAVDDGSSEEGAKGNVDKVVDSMLTKSEDGSGAAEEREEVSEENMDKHKDSLSIKSEDDAGAAEGVPAVSEANMDKHEDSIVTESGKNGNTTESSNAALKENAGNREYHASTENDEVTSASGASDTLSEENVEKNEDPKTSKIEENTNDAESKENLDKVDGSIIDTSGKDASTSEDSEEVLEENMGKNEAKALEGESSKEQIGTAVAGDVSSEDSERFEEDKTIEKDAVESSSSDKDSEENKENVAAEETALKKDVTSEEEDEVSEKSNKEMESEHGAALGNSSEETSDVEDEAGDIEVNENQSSTHQESHVTSSPFAQLNVLSSDNHNIGKDEQHSDNAAAMEGHERNPSVEETAENEAGSPDELIENDRVDSEVLKSDNKTAALGKAMPITGAEEDAQNKDESLQDANKDSETEVLKELENTEGKNSLEQDLNNENEEEKVESTINGAPENKHESESKKVVLGGKLLDDNEENEKDNFLDKDDIHPEAHLAHSSEKNEDEFDVDEDSLNIVYATGNASEDEGSGIAPGMIGFSSHSDSAHKDTSEISSQEKHEAEINDRNKEKEGNNDDEDAEVSEKEETKLSKETSYHTAVFGDSGSGHNEEEHGHFGKQDNNGTEDVEDGAGSGGHALPGHYEDDIASEEHTTKSNVPIIGDNEESSAEYSSESPASENETSTKIAIFEQADNQNESDHFEEGSLALNNTNVQAMSMNPTPVPDESDDQHMAFDGSGDDDTTTPVAIIIHADIIDDNMAVATMEMDLVNSSVIGEASPAYQEKPVEKVVSPELAAAPLPPTTGASCVADEENDCLLQSNKPHEDAGVINILEDDDEVPPEPTKGGIHTKSSINDLNELEVVISTTPAVKVPIEEESLQRSIAVDHNKPLLHSNKEASSTTIAPEIQEITEPIEDHEAMDNETINIGAPDTIVEHPLGETGIKEMSGKIRAANVNELGVSGQENSDDLGEPEALDSSSASGSYVVLGCIMAVVIVLLAYAAIKSRRERGTNTTSKKQSEVAGDDDDGTELKDMKKALLPPETPHDDRNGDIEANRKPLMDKDENQEEDEEKEPIIKQNGTLELSEPPKDVESQVDSSTAENQLKTAPTPSKPQQRNGLSEVVVEKPAMSNGKADSIITHPVAAKVKVIENEDSIAKTPVIINRGGNSPPH